MGKFAGPPQQFDGKNHGFRLRFSLKPIQWYITWWFLHCENLDEFLPGSDPRRSLHRHFRRDWQRAAAATCRAGGGVDVRELNGGLAEKNYDLP